MKTGSTLWKLIALAGLFLVSLGFIVLGSSPQSVTSPPNTGMADPDALIRAFDRYVAGLSVARGGRFLTMPLTSLRGLTNESFNAGGTVRIDLTNGSVVSEIRGLPSGDSFDLWLLDNRSGLA